MSMVKFIDITRANFDNLTPKADTSLFFVKETNNTYSLYKGSILVSSNITLPSHSHTWSSITGKPATFTPSSHTHTIANITNLQTTLDKKIEPQSSSIVSGDCNNITTTSIYQGSWTSNIPTGANSYGTLITTQTSHGSPVYLRQIYLSSGSTEMYTRYSSSTSTWREWEQIGAWSSITGKPTTFTPSSHGHAWGEITGKPTTFTPSSHSHSISNITSLQSTLDDKVDKVSGKGLSTNDYTNADKSKLDGIAPGAEVNVQADWNETAPSNDAFIKNKPDITLLQTTLDKKIEPKSSSVASENCDYAGTTSIYQGKWTFNIPTGANSYGTLITTQTTHGSSSQLRQIYLPEGSTKMYTRVKASTWQAWEQVGTVTQVKIDNTIYNPNSEGVISLPAYPDTSIWTEVWSGSINLNSYTNSYYYATVPSDYYVGKRIAIEVQYGSGTTYTSNIIFGVLGTTSSTTPSTSIVKGMGWNYFDGTYLRVKTLFAYASPNKTATIYVGHLKTLFGTFSGTTIEWKTSHSETLYMKKIWVIE